MHTGFCSPSSTRSFGATPFARKSFNVSVTYPNGFCLITCVPDSLMSLLPTLSELCVSSSAPSALSLAFLFSNFHFLFLQSIRMNQNLPRQPILQFAERILKFVQRNLLSKQRLQIQPPGLQQRRHLHPGLIHPPPINPLHRRALENHVVHQIQRHIFRRYPQQRSSSPRAQRLESLLNRARHPAHLQQHIHARSARLRHNLFHRVFRRRIDHHVCAHLFGHLAPVRIRLRRKHRRASASLRHRNGHQSNRPASRHQRRLPRNRSRQHRVHRVSQRIKNRAIPLRNRR